MTGLIKQQFFSTALPCRAQVTNHLAEKFATVSEALSHYGIDLQLSDNNRELMARCIAAATPMQSSVHFPVSTAKAFFQAPDTGTVYALEITGCLSK